MMVSDTPPPSRQQTGSCPSITSLAGLSLCYRGLRRGTLCQADEYHTGSKGWLLLWLEQQQHKVTLNLSHFSPPTWKL